MVMSENRSEQGERSYTHLLCHAPDRRDVLSAPRSSLYHVVAMRTFFMLFSMRNSSLVARTDVLHRREKYAQASVSCRP
jgi:hypothetical protein